MRNRRSTIQAIRRARKLFAAVLWVLSIGVYPTVASGAIWHVTADATAANNGTSWTDAFTELYSALDVATAGDEIWIAAITYTPVDAASSLVLVEGVGVYGGFVGTESSRNERTVSAIETILSGDIDADDNPSAIPGWAGSTRWYNGWHWETANAANIVTGTNLSASSVLDGVTITGGRGGPCAQGSCP